MDVILVKDVKSLGKIGDIVPVARGFALHYLIANKFAIYSTDQNKKIVQEKKNKLLKDDELEKSQLLQICTKIHNQNLQLVMQASKDGKLFGSVNAKKISLEISKIFSVEVNYLNIKLTEPIKQTGIHDIEIFFTDEIKANIKLFVAESESAIKKMVSFEK
ncbi:MAG: 50S ribosomal protein L9 [Rickettsia sp.]|nr:50S ribosomal protein L9 [Rickettsia sp.]